LDSEAGETAFSECSGWISLLHSKSSCKVVGKVNVDINATEASIKAVGGN
jgi:hypothetical protein